VYGLCRRSPSTAETGVLGVAAGVAEGLAVAAWFGWVDAV
jgi:hypothetical protein